MNIQVEELPEESKQVVSKVETVAHEPLEHLSLSKRYNIDAPTKQEEQMLKEIWEYAKGLSKIGDSSDIMWQVINLEGVIGAPQIGSSRLEKLYRYAKLRRQERQIQEEIRHVATSDNL
jgi:hypothetical protein